MNEYNDKEYDCVVLHARYLKLRLHLDEEKLLKAREEFMKEYFEVCKTVPEDEKMILEDAVTVGKQKPEQKETPPPVEEKQTTSKKKPEAIKKVYKEIAKKSHPDALIGVGKEEFNKKMNLFQEAQTAADESNLAELLQIAAELDLKVDISTEENAKIIQKSVENMKTKIKQIKQTTAWQWYFAESYEDKHDIMLTYMQHMYKEHK